MKYLWSREYEIFEGLFFSSKSLPGSLSSARASTREVFAKNRFLKKSLSFYENRRTTINVNLKS